MRNPGVGSQRRLRRVICTFDIIEHIRQRVAVTGLEHLLSKTPVQPRRKTVSYNAGRKMMVMIGRRSKRLALSVPVVVYGRLRDKSTLREKTRTLSVSAHGGMVALTAAVQSGQTILLVNEATREEQECQLVYVGSRKRGKTEVGVAFTRRAPNFWQVSFPPVGRRSTSQRRAS